MRKQLEAASFLPRAAEALLLPRPSQGRAEQVWEDLCPEQGTWEDFVGSGGSSVLRVCVCVCACARAQRSPVKCGCVLARCIHVSSQQLCSVAAGSRVLAEEVGLWPFTCEVVPNAVPSPMQMRELLQSCWFKSICYISPCVFLRILFIFTFKNYFCFSFFCLYCKDL